MTDPTFLQATCDTCSGKGNILHRRRTSGGGSVSMSVLCPTCKGKGVIKVKVEAKP